MQIMDSFFSSVIQKITVVMITITSILPGATSNTNKPTDTSTATSSATVSESPKPTPTSKPSTQTKEKPIQLEQTNTLTKPSITTTPVRQVYQIIPMGDISALPNDQKQQFIEMYNEFLQTPYLQYMTPDQQNEVFKQIAGTYLSNYKIQLQQQLTQLQNELNQAKAQSTPVPTPSPTLTPFQPDPIITAKIDELRQTLSNIQGQPVAMNVIEGRKQAAYQKWMQNNFDAYAVISGNSYYLNLLNSIKGAYGI